MKVNGVQNKTAFVTSLEHKLLMRYSRYHELHSIFNLGLLIFINTIYGMFLTSRYTLQKICTKWRLLEYILQENTISVFLLQKFTFNLICTLIFLNV